MRWRDLLHGNARRVENDRVRQIARHGDVHPARLTLNGNQHRLIPLVHCFVKPGLEAVQALCATVAA
jgi:hypothetical protein